MTIQEVAEQTGVSAFTIRFYEKLGVLPPVQRLPNGIRDFTEADIAHVRFLTQLKQTGMSLKDIAAFTDDGCMLERLRQGAQIPAPIIEKRMALLLRHQQRLVEQRRNLDTLLDAVQQKLDFYERSRSGSATAE